MKYNNKSLYVHIPFCRNICSYCDFRKFIYNQNKVNGYIASLINQIKELKDNNYETIYIGGGTPSSLDNKSLEILLGNLCSKLASNYKEFTIECNVEDITKSFLETIVKYKVNRLSIGVQSFIKDNIDFCNRKHTKKQAIKNIKLACKYIKNSSIDMIFGFPNQSIINLYIDLLTSCFLPIKHISYYSLQIEEGTKIYTQKVKEIDNNKAAKMYRIIYKTLRFFGYVRYEISNFSYHNKYQSFHNKVYWKNEKYDAIGMTSSGYCDNVRYKNIDNINKFIEKDYTLSEQTILNKDDIIFDEIMLGLRLDEGINIDDFNRKYSTDFEKRYDNIIKKCCTEKLLVIKDRNIKCTLKGSLLLNDILEMFLR